MPVSLLGGTTFRCTIPRRTLLVFPVGGYVSWGYPPRKLHARVLAGFDRIRDLELVLDGRALKPGHVLTTPVYIVGLPLRNSLGAPPGPISMMSKDAFAILSPLPAGPHTMHVRITFHGAARSYAATYRLLVR